MILETTFPTKIDMPTIQRQFSHQKLRSAREDSGWSRMQLAFALNCTYETVVLYETGKIVPPIKRLLHIGEVLEVDVRDFFSNDA